MGCHIEYCICMTFVVDINTGFYTRKRERAVNLLMLRADLKLVTHMWNRTFLYIENNTIFKWENGQKLRKKYISI